MRVEVSIYTYIYTSKSGREKEQGVERKSKDISYTTVKMCRFNYNCIYFSYRLYNGLYVIGATSSLGKTTFIHQLSEQLATNGNDVLFFSLEQSRLELLSKSFSRISAQNDIDTAISSISIRSGYYTNKLPQLKKQYKENVSDRLSLIEGNFNSNLDFIQSKIYDYIKFNNVKPVIVIDYLQILKPTQNQIHNRYGIKERIDDNLTILKQISRDNNLTIIVISSVNRANYLAPIDYESFKESGGIEFTADVIWGLHLDVLNTTEFQALGSGLIVKKRNCIKKAKGSVPRDIELVCLKNRFGIASYEMKFTYDPRFDLFTENVVATNEMRAEREKENDLKNKPKEV